jgi:hypothetical protein
MQTGQSTMIAIRVSYLEKEKFKLLSELERKPVSQVVKELVDKELKARKLTATDIRKLPKESRAAILKQMTEEAMPVYNKYKQELYVDETGDGIE